jgi:hypothetical protein
MAFADSQVDRARCARHERDRGRLVALAGDPKDPMAALDGQVLDVGLARLADPHPIQAEEHSEGPMGVVIGIGGGEEHAKFGAVEPASVGRMDLGPADVLGRVRSDPAVDVSKPVEAAHGRESSVDR